MCGQRGANGTLQRYEQTFVPVSLSSACRRFHCPTLLILLLLPLLLLPSLFPVVRCWSCCTLTSSSTPYPYLLLPSLPLLFNYVFRRRPSTSAALGRWWPSDGGRGGARRRLGLYVLVRPCTADRRRDCGEGLVQASLSLGLGVLGRLRVPKPAKKRPTGRPLGPGRKGAGAPSAHLIAYRNPLNYLSKFHQSPSISDLSICVQRRL